MAEKISQRIGAEPRRLKIGKSFEKKSGGPYHGIRYDFKPVSIDEERDGLLEVKENNSVAVGLPHVDGSGQTNYKGHISNASTKECILIIDHETGELTIERLSNQILLKKTRAEKTESGVDKFLPLPPQSSSLPYSNPYEVKKTPDSNPYAVKKTPDSNPYAVKKVPDKPSGGLTPREMIASHRPRKPSTSRDGNDTDFSITPMNSAKSSPAGPGSAKPSPNRFTQVDSLGRPLDSDTTESSSSSDSDSDFGDDKVGGAAPEPVSSLFSEDFSSAVPSLPKKSVGVLPTARPQPPLQAHKVKPPPPAKQTKPENSMSNILGDDLRLSDSDNDSD